MPESGTHFNEMEVDAMQHEVKAQARLCMRDGRKATADVTLDGCIRFSVVLRSCTDKETKKEKGFLSYPRKYQDGRWEDVLLADEVLKRHVMAAVGNAITAEVTEKGLPPVTKVTFVPVNQGKPLTGKMTVRGMADVEIDGLTIRGVSLKETEKGYLINMPQYRADSGEYRDLVDVISGSMRERIKEAVMAEYAALTGALNNTEIGKGRGE